MKSLLYILVSVVSLSSCAQTKSAIKNSYAYSQVRIAGMIAVDENGNPLTKGVDTIYTIFLETTGNAVPTVQTAWINNTAYSASLVPLEEKSVEVGLSTAQGKAVSINAAAGNKLWRVDIGQPLANKTLPAASGQERRINSVVIQGILDKKSFTQTIGEIKQLPRMEGL